MKNIKKLRTEQSGVAHLGLIIVALFVFGAVGLVGYRVVNKNNPDATSVSVSTEEQGDFDEDVSSSDDLKSLEGQTEENDE